MEKAEFKRGDRVVCVDAAGYSEAALVRGRVYEVLEWRRNEVLEWRRNEKNRDKIRFTGDDGQNHAAFAYRFVLAKPIPPTDTGYEEYQEIIQAQEAIAHDGKAEVTS